MSRLIDADALKKDLDAWVRVINKPQFYNREETLHIIDKAPTVEPKRGEWINVKERLPGYNPAEPAKAYFVAYDTNRGKQIQIALYSDYMFATTMELPSCVTWRDYENHKIKNVTHWMPLPQPPKMEEQITK
jgi:hypothetical protein